MTSSGFYEANYDVLVDRPLSGEVSSLEADSKTKRCRFCEKNEPDTTFRNKAHAVPEALGNKSIFSPNECDACNTLFGSSYEDHLGRAILFERAVSGIRGKNRFPTNKEGNGLRIEWVDGKQTITLTDPELFRSVNDKDGRFAIQFTREGLSQPFMPRYASMALLKIACSLCPPTTVPQIQPTIDWLMGRAEASLSSFPVFYTYTNGENPYGEGRALLLKRTGRHLTPLLWCIVASSNHRFQFFVPFTTEDSLLVESGRMSFKAYHYPTWVESNEIDYDCWNWCSGTKEPRSFDLNFDIQEATIEHVDPRA